MITTTIETHPGITTDAPGTNAWLWHEVPDPAAPVDDAFERERRHLQEMVAFNRLRPSLDMFAGMYVAVHNEEVVDSDSSSAALVRRFFDRHGDTHVYIGFVGEEQPARMLTPRGANA